MRKEQELFKKIIMKAEKNGYCVVQWLPAFPFAKEEKIKRLKKKMWTLLYSIKEKILFSKEFAKKYWGEGDVATGEYNEVSECPNNCDKGKYEGWGSMSWKEIKKYYKFCSQCGAERIIKKYEIKDVDPWEYHRVKMLNSDNELEYLEKSL